MGRIIVGLLRQNACHLQNAPQIQFSLWLERVRSPSFVEGFDATTLIPFHFLED
jgi:hypothetical protein